MTAPISEGLQEAWPTEPAGPPPPRRTPLHYLRELPVLLVLAFGVALLMKTFLLQMFYIPSPSMEPLLVKDDRVAVNKLAYRLRDPRRGEVIVFIRERNETPKSTLQRIKSFLFEGLGVTPPPEVDFIKRIVGLPGETIQVTRTKVLIRPANGGKRFALDEGYTRVEGGTFVTTQAPLKIPAGHYFVMGDNRNNSSDSRVFGPIKRTDIIGKAFVKIWPLDRLDVIEPQTYPESGAAVGPEAGAVSLIAWRVRRRRAR